MPDTRPHPHTVPTPTAGDGGSGPVTGSFGVREEVFRAIFEEAGIGMALVDLEGRPVAANRRLQQILGYTEPELRSMTFPEFTHPDDVRADWELFEELVRGDRSHYQLDKRYLRKDGGIVHGRLTVSLVRNPDGSPRQAVGMVEDVTAQHEAAAALATEERQHREILSSLADGVLLFDREGRLVFLNPAAERLLGVSRAEAVGWLCEDPRLGLGTPALGGGGVTQVLASGEPVHGVELSRRHPDGGRVAWETSAAPLRGADGELEGVVVSMRDITDRNRAEEALREAEERLRTLVETIPAVTYVTPSDWTRQPYLYVSPQIEDLLGYPAEEWTSDPGLWYRILHPEDADRAVAESEAVDLTGEPFESEYRLIAKDGRVVWVLDRARPIPGPDGQPHLWQGILFDVTEQKRAQAELGEREAMLRAIFESEPECVKLVGADGALLQMNPAGLAMIEADGPEQVLGGCVYPIVAEEHRAAFRTLTEAAFRGESGTLEFDIVGLKGTRRTMETHAAPLRAASGEVIACLSISRDVTERKRAAAELEATLADLRRVNEARLAALSRLVRAQEEERRRIAEDLHDDPVQRLTAVGIRLATLTEATEDQAQRERLRALEGAIADVIGRLRSMMFHLRPPELDGDGLIDAVREHLARLADEAGWECRVEGELAVRPSAEVASAAYRIIQEALRNAQKHAAATRVMVALGSDAATLRGTVRDDGVGFDPTSVPGHHEGHLGLVSMRERAELFGGTCDVESAPGRGTLVRFCLPLAGDADASRNDPG